MTRASRGGLAALVVAMVCLALPALGSAATTIQSPGGFSIIYDADPGQTNNLVVTRSGANYVFTDSPGVAITAFAPCSAVANVGTCPAATVRSFSVELDDLNDSGVIDDSISGEDIDDAAIFAGAGDDMLVAAKSVPTQLSGDNNDAQIGTDTITGGDQDDTLLGAGGPDTITGGLGNDRMIGGPGIDLLDAGPGNDSFDGGSGPDGADVLLGGPDRDSADFRSRTGPLTVSLDGVADDGENCPGATCEGDNFAEIEDFDGGSGNDTITGNAAANRLTAGPGSNTINGGDGADSLQGQEGNDQLNGEGGNDELFASDGSDTLSGGDGDDLFGLTFTDETDTYSGGAGNDRLEAFGFSRVGVTIDLDGVADDGLVNPGFTAALDNVQPDIENFAGGDGDDLLIGSDAANEIDGFDGNDTILGGAGADALEGDRGDDSLSGGSASDTLTGGAGVDRLRARDDSPDQLDCGSSLDTALADALDQPEASCESLSRGLKIAAKAKAAGDGDTAKLELTCPAAEQATCAVKLKLTKGKTRLAKTKAKIAAGDSKKVKLKLTDKGAQRLADQGKLKGLATATFTDADGSRVASTQKVVVK